MSNRTLSYLALSLLWTSPAAAQLDVVLETVAVRGEHPAGTPDGVTYTNLQNAAINNSDEIAFRSNTSEAGGGGNGLWGGRASDLAAIVLAGQPAPGTGTTFHNLASSGPTDRSFDFR